MTEKRKAIPAAALARRLAFVGTTGSGKTYTAKGGVERKLHAKERIVVIDPLDVWWGLRLSADGKSPSPFEVVIFGGKHADMQISENGGKLLGEAVATATESCIVSLGALRTEAARRRFMVAFLDALYENTDPDKSEPYTVVFDEADMWAPQKPFGGNAEQLLHLMEEIVRRGRVRGFTPWLISQRPAIVNKNVLSQVDGMVAMQLTGTNDRNAIGAWIEGHADRNETKELLASLAGLQQGNGLLWVPRDGILETMHFPENVTFDSSRTPKRGEKKRDTKLKPLNLDKLKDKLATVEAETKANDPAALKKKIADLETQIRKQPAAGVMAASQTELAGEYRRGVIDGTARGKADGYARGLQEADAAYSAFGKELGNIEGAVLAAIAQTKSRRAAFDKLIQKSGSPAVPEPADTPTRATAAPSPAARTPSPAASGDGTLTNPQRTLLQALAWWKQMGHEEPSRTQVAAIAGWKPSGSNLKDRLSELSKSGHVTYPRQGFVALTYLGFVAAPAPDTAITLLDSIRGILTGPQLKLFNALEKHRQEVARADLAGMIDPPWEPNGSNLKDRLSELSRLELVDYPQRGTVALQNWVTA